MQATPERVHSDQNKDRAHRRKKFRDDAVSKLPNDSLNHGSRKHKEAQSYNREYRDYSKNKSYGTYDEGYDAPSTEQLTDSFAPNSPARHSGESRPRMSKKPISRQRPSVEENDYVNAPYGSYIEQPEQYHDREYGCPEDSGVTETFLEPDESFQSDYPHSRTSQSHPSRRHRTHRDGALLPANDREPSVLSVSDYGRESAISTTPHALGGNERVFWNPEPELDNTAPSNPPQLQHTTGLQRFLASFRRLKKAKHSSNAAVLTEPNVTDSCSAFARVIMLDGEELSYKLDRNETGQSLLARVCQTADIVETDYFGLTYVSNKLRTWFWLDTDRKISKQLRTGEQWLFSFQVKFYPPEPTLLQEDITRYQLTLQVRQDIYTGKLPCSWVTQALLGSFMVQAELGDYDEREHGISTEYLKEFEFVPSPTPQLLQKIAELHKTHVGMKPSQADVKYLETAKRLELYGVDLHPVRDMENVDIYLGVGFHGIVIYRDRLRIGRFAWPKVLRISYKKNNFFLKIRPDHSEPIETIIGFRLLNHYLANRLWKSAVEHHSFFRLKEARTLKMTAVAPLKSNYTYTGHTFFQYRTMNINRPHPHFDRSLTKRRTSSMPTGLNKAPSMHTLNRAHPRDMTMGRAQTSDNVGPRRSAQGHQLFSSTRPTGPASQMNGTIQDEVGQPDSQSQLSRHSNGVVEHSLSYGSPRHSYTAGSQSHDYINQPRDPMDLSADRSLLTGSLASGYGSQYSQSESSQRRPPTVQRQPNSPIHAAAAWPSTSRTRSRETNRQAGEIHSTSHKPPTGGVPVLGGVMITDSVLARHSRSNTDSSGPATKHRHHREVESPYPEDGENYWDDPVEYDDDEVEQLHCPQKNTPGRHRPQSRGSCDQSIRNEYNRGDNQDHFLSTHAPRRSENVEMML